MNFHAPQTRRFDGPTYNQNWSQEEIEYLKTLVAENTPTQCAAKLTERFRRTFTLNMASGKAHRLGLRFRKGRSRSPDDKRSWSNEEIDFLKNNMNENSLSQLAIKLTERFGRAFTRNMVVGKVDRLSKGQLPRIKREPTIRRMVWARKPKLAIEVSERQRLKRQAMFPDIEAQFGHIFGAVPFVEMVGCHYPTQTNERDEHLFCNAPIALNGELSEEVKNACPVYCRAHALIATQPRPWRP